MVNEDEGVATSVRRLWLTDHRVAPAATTPMFSSDSQLDSSEDDGASHCTYSLAAALPPPHHDGHRQYKRKESSAGGPSNASAANDQNKRHRPLPQYSGASSSCASVSTSSEHEATNPLHTMQTKFIALSPPLSRLAFADQVTCAVAAAAPEVDACDWSTDNGNGGDNETSGGHSSTLTLSEDGYSRSIGKSDWNNVSPFNGTERQRKDPWSGGSILQAQLDSFINKEKQKLESSLLSDLDASSGGSERSLSGLLHSYGSMEHQMSIELRARSSTAGGSSSGASMSSFLGASTQYTAQNLQNPPSAAVFPSHSQKASRDAGLRLGAVNEVRASVMRTEEEERDALTHMICGLRRPPFPSARREEDTRARSRELQQKFVLSSGRLSHVEAVQMGERTPTIDCDFDDYFAKLML